MKLRTPSPLVIKDEAPVSFPQQQDGYKYLSLLSKYSSKPQVNSPSRFRKKTHTGYKVSRPLKKQHRAKQVPAATGTAPAKQYQQKQVQDISSDEDVLKMGDDKHEHTISSYKIVSSLLNAGSPVLNTSRRSTPDEQPDRMGNISACSHHDSESVKSTKVLETKTGMHSGNSIYVSLSPSGNTEKNKSKISVRIAKSPVRDKKTTKTRSLLPPGYNDTRCSQRSPPRSTNANFKDGESHDVARTGSVSPKNKPSSSSPREQSSGKVVPQVKKNSGSTSPKPSTGHVQGNVQTKTSKPVSPSSSPTKHLKSPQKDDNNPTSDNKGGINLKKSERGS